MKYMLLFAGSEEYFETFRSFPEEVQKEALARVSQWQEEQTAAGRLLEGHRLQPASTATTVRLQHGQNGVPTGKALVTDGPFIDAKERIGAALFIKGNVDPVGTLLQGSPDDCYADACHRLETAKAGGGYILSTACSVSPATPPANIMTLRSAADDAGRY